MGRTPDLKLFLERFSCTIQGKSVLFILGTLSITVLIQIAVCLGDINWIGGITRGDEAVIRAVRTFLLLQALLVVAATVVMACIVFLFSRGISHSIANLGKRARAVGRGENSVREPVMGFPELQSLSDELCRMAEDLRNREKDHDLTRAELAAFKERLGVELSALKRVHQIGTRFVREGELGTVLDETLDAAIAITGADMGHIQMLDDSGSLKIIAQRGFEQPFLEFFNSIPPGFAASGVALEKGERVIVEDIARSSLFEGSAAGEIVLASGARGVQATPLFNRAGVLIGMLTTHYRTPRRADDRDFWLLDLLAQQAADIFERKIALQALSDSQIDLNRAQAVAQTGSWRLDVRRNILMWSNETYRIFGIPSGTPMTYELFLSTVHPSDRDDVRQKWTKALQGESYDMEHRIVVGDRVKWVSERAELEFDDGGGLLGGFGTVQDITERKEMEESLRRARDELELRVRERTSDLKIYMEKLERSNQVLRDFASIASHDMHEPLRKVLSFGKRLSQKYSAVLDDEGRDYLDRIIKASERMRSLLTALLEYSRVTMREESFARVDIGATVREVLSDLEVRMENTKGEVLVDEFPAIEADPTQLRQLFQNLISNALKFHKEGSRPVVKLRCGEINQNNVRIMVEDNGIGFEEQFADRIFAPFQRLCGRSEYEGTGMGLAICKKIVERHGGAISAAGRPGAGTTFTIVLPLRQQRVRNTSSDGGGDDGPARPTEQARA